MARRIGVRVLTFSLGFGPKILSFRRGDTEYCVSAIPLGGYVKMAGETPEDARTGASDEFLSKSKWQRFQVLVMGPVMNLALAFIVMTFVLMQSAQSPAFQDDPVVVGGVAAGSPGDAAGIQVGDRVVAVGDRQVPAWRHFFLETGSRAQRPTRLLIERDGKQFERTITPVPVDRFESGATGIIPVTHPRIDTLQSGQPGELAGLRKGDSFLGIRGTAPLKASPQDLAELGGGRMSDFDLGVIASKKVSDELVQRIKSSEGNPLTFDIKRGQEQLSITVVPHLVDEQMRIGAQIAPLDVKTEKLGLVRAAQRSIEQNWEWTTLIFRTLGGLFTRETSVKQLMGPVAIADLSGTAAQQDSWIPLFTLMAMISLNLGLLNLMPIPVLDGGHIAILALEGVSRRDFSMKVKEKMLLAGFVLLLMLMATVIYNDLMRIQWIERLVPWR